MKKRIELGTALFFIVAAVMISCIVTYMYMAHMVERTTGKSAVFEKLSQVYQVINNRYIGELDDDEAMDSLLSGYVDGIDQYGVYLNKTDYLDFKNDQEGKQSGIGVSIKYIASSGYMKISRVKAGSPCDEAGIKAGDVICVVNDVDLSTLSYTEAAKRLKANVGTELRLTLQRGETQFNATVVVKEFKNATVSYRPMVNQIGYVAIYEFGQNTAADFKAAVEDLKGQGATRFVFDVRNNTGGSLNAVAEVLDYILPKGTLCTVKDKEGEKETYSSDEKCMTEKITVLINGSTYSGGELFAAAIRDFKYGTLVGATTYGKGMAQDVIPLGDDTALYLSTHLYYPPSGENYEGIGVAPDQEVLLSADAENRFYELTYEEDLQLQAAVNALN